MKNYYGPANNRYLTFLISMVARIVGFKQANAKIHDDDYEKGGDWIDRLRCDTGFLRKLLIDSNRIWYKIIVAYIFYFNVRIIGKYCFNYTDKYE